MAALVAVLAVPAGAHARQRCDRICQARQAHLTCVHGHGGTIDQNRRWAGVCIRHAILHNPWLRPSQRAWLYRVNACETGRTWSIWSHNPSGSTSWFQFLPSTWRSTPYGRRWIYSPLYQPLAAVYMLQVGRAPGEWSCK